MPHSEKAFMPSIISGHVHAPMRDDTVIRLHDVWNAHAASTIAVTWCLKAKWSKSLRVGVFGGGGTNPWYLVCQCFTCDGAFCYIQLRKILNFDMYSQNIAFCSSGQWYVLMNYT